MFLSVIVPFYNEEDNVNTVYCNIKDNLPKYLSKVEFIFVSDGSTDNTVSVIQNLQSKDRRITLVALEKNSGYGFALRSGFAKACGDYLTYLDGDAQYDFKDFTLLKDQLNTQNAFLCGGVRTKRADNSLRSLLSFCGKTLVRLIFGINIADIDCGFKLLKKELLDTIDLQSSSGLIFSLELYLKTKHKGFIFTQKGISHKNRKYGFSKGINFTQYRLAVKDIFKIIKKSR